MEKNIDMSQQQSTFFSCLVLTSKGKTIYIQKKEKKNLAVFCPYPHNLSVAESNGS